MLLLVTAARRPTGSFSHKPGAAPISLLEIHEFFQDLAPSAFVDGGRQYYLPMNEREFAAFLHKTRIERGTWREAQNDTDPVEKTCTSYSLLLFGLVEQERLKSRVRLPLAFCRVTLYGHSLNGFFNENREFKLIDPRLDRIFTLEEWAAYSPRDTTINVVIFQ